MASWRESAGPARRLSSWRFSGFVHNVREEFDCVLVDCYPVGLVSDPAIHAAQEGTVDARPRFGSGR